MKKIIKVEQEEILCDVCGEEGKEISMTKNDWTRKDKHIDLCYKHEKITEIARLFREMTGEFGDDEMNTIKEILEEIEAERNKVEKPVIEVLIKRLKSKSGKAE